MFDPLISTKKKRQFSFGRLSFLFVLFTFLFSFFSLLSNCRFRRKDKSEKRREKVALLRKALNKETTIFFRKIVVSFCSFHFSLFILLFSLKLSFPEKR